jgi:hypothetical protein
MILPTGAQLPVPETAHDWQLPQGPLEQQTPSVHIVLRHCVPAVHDDPSGSRFVQEPAWQVSPPVQSPLLAQAVRQPPELQT